jgi:hypothetical protein
LVKRSEAQKPKVQRLSTLPAYPSPAPVNKVTKPSKPVGPSIPPVLEFTGLEGKFLVE